jgi:hypothetical protein
VLNTFFFGYLPLKWKRLVRVLSIGAIAILPFFLFELFEDIAGSIGEYEALIFILFLTVTALLIGLISWVLKPFIVKD